MQELSDYPSYYAPLSLRLHQVMEDIGATLEARNLMKECAAIEEITETAAFPDLSVYIFGSSYEGSTTPSMKSDVDLVCIMNCLPVVNQQSDHPDGVCLLFVQDDITPPGYCTLQLVRNGVLLFGEDSVSSNYFLTICADGYNRLVCSFKPSQRLLQQFSERHGPALTKYYEDPIQDQDNVVACKSNRWPECTSEWSIRHRIFNWPTSEMVKTCESYGCIYVPVGHPHSNEQHLQWRISLSQQERFLVTQFNSTQLQCFILLKLTNKGIIRRYVPHSLSSYHIKTCMFYMIENTPKDFWRPANLLKCFVACLHMLTVWAETGVCPNYFIPAENMFDRGVHGEAREKLIEILQQLLSDDCKYLLHIRTEGLGERLYLSCLQGGSAAASPNGLMVFSDFRERTIHYCLQTFAKSFENCRNCLVNRFNCCKINTEQWMDTLCRSIGILRKTLKVSDHSYEETQRATSLMLPYLELCLVSNIIALSVKEGNSKDQIWSYLLSEKWQEICKNSDSFSFKLKQASFMYTQGYYDAALDVLSSLTGLARLTVCGCYNYGVFPDSEIVSSILRANIPADTSEVMTELLKSVIIPCVYFLPTEREVTPTALVYEMMRKDGTHVAPSDEIDVINFRYSDWAIVDGQFLLHFLFYLNHSKLNMTSYARADIANMEWTLNTKNVSHRETCLNLLGWVFLEQGCTDRAMDCFELSLEITPDFNAANLHIKALEESEL